MIKKQNALPSVLRILESCGLATFRKGSCDNRMELEF